MKINQTENQLELKTNGTLQALIGILVIIVGIIVTVTVLMGIFKDVDGKAYPIWMSLIGVVLLIGGIVSTIFSKNRLIILQKGGSSSVTSKKVLGGQPQSTTFDTSRIVAVSLSTHISVNNNISSSTNNSSGNQRRSDLSLVLDDNSLVPIASSSGGISGGIMTNLIIKAPLSKEANQISAFLEVPLQSSGMSDSITDIKSIVDTVRQQPNQPQSNPITTVESVNNQTPFNNLQTPLNIQQPVQNNDENQKNDPI